MGGIDGTCGLMKRLPQSILTLSGLLCTPCCVLLLLFLINDHFHWLQQTQNLLLCLCHTSWRTNDDDILTGMTLVWNVDTSTSVTLDGFDGLSLRSDQEAELVMWKLNLNLDPTLVSEIRETVTNQIFDSCLS